ncbi:sensor histidine kinase [Chitinophaga sp. HK235]|uniref:sensor histidine kinase n=1 Tax=Chitinophaga sp. HK235 TaxID=2952571 RepID=UPI001BA5BE71|nr:histidine kinase [Chitinophaga sp. HK235]
MQTAIHSEMIQLPLWMRKSVAYKILCHVLPAVILYFAVGMDEYQPAWQAFMKVLGLIFFLAGPYVNIYLLVPGLLLRYRYYEYIMAVFGVITFLMLLTVWMEPLMTPLLKAGKSFKPYHTKDALVFYVMMLALLAASTAVKLFGQWLETGYHRAISLQTELENLKKQLSPHFLFNTLNNLDTLIYADQQRASEVVHTLSRLLRYQLYLAGNGQVGLPQELSFIHDFLYLEKLRHDVLDVSVNTTGNIQAASVHALLLMPFVENAVKHNDYNGHPYINLELTVTDGQLVFCCVNPVAAAGTALPGGAGLKNVRRRLALLYPCRHSLQVENKDQLFVVTLTLSI